MIKIKNVRPGILIIADAGLKLAPGESVELEKLTRQAQKAVDDGLLACTDNTPAARGEVKQGTKPEAKAESRPKGKTAAQAAESKETSKKRKSQPAEEEQPPAPEEDPDAESTDAKPEDKPKESGQGELLGTGDAAK